MAEIKLFYHKDGIVRLSRSLDFLKSNPIQNFLWIDLNDVDEEVENELEDFLKIYIQEEEEMIEIEMSSRYIETNDTLVVNSNFLLSNFETDPVSFILKNNILVTVRGEELISFHETVKKISANPKNYPTGAHVLVALLETRVEFDADMIENMTQKITQLSNSLTLQEADEELLSEIKNLTGKNHSCCVKTSSTNSVSYQACYAVNLFLQNYSRSSPSSSKTSIRWWNTSSSVSTDSIICRILFWVMSISSRTRSSKYLPLFPSSSCLPPSSRVFTG